MLRKYLTTMLLLSLPSICFSQTKEETTQWVMSKLNKYSAIPVETRDATTGEIIYTTTPLYEWTFKKGKLSISCKRNYKKGGHVFKYVYTFPAYAVDSVGYETAGDKKQFLRLYMNCKCNTAVSREMILGGAYAAERTEKIDTQELFFHGDEEENFKDRLNKAFAKLKEYYPHSDEAF